MVRGCPFCAIVAGTAPATVLAETESSMIIVPLGPVVEHGHVLVLPREHVPHYAVDPQITAQTCADAAMWTARVGWEAANLITSMGAAATQSVDHLHVHLLRRVDGDGLTLPWTAQQAAAPDRPRPLRRGSPCPDPGCGGSLVVSAVDGLLVCPLSGHGWPVGSYALDHPTED